MLLLDRDGDAFTLAFELRHGREPEPMRLERTERLWFKPAGPPEDLLAVAQCVRLLALKYGRLVEVLQEELKVSERTAARLVDRAKRAGVIRKTEVPSTVATRKLTGDRSSGVRVGVSLTPPTRFPTAVGTCFSRGIASARAG